MRKFGKYLIFTLVFLLVLHKSNTSYGTEVMHADLVIVGSSAVGQGAIQAILEKENNLKTLWVSKESQVPYDKVHLKDYLITENVKDLEIVSVSPKIQTKFGFEVISLDPKANFIEVKGPHGIEKIKFKKLLLGLGLKNKKLEIEMDISSQYRNLFSYYSLSDTNAILNYIKHNKIAHVAIIGTGVNAIECASALNKRGINVSIIGRSQNILSKLFEPKESDILKKLINQKEGDKVKFYTIPSKLKVVSVADPKENTTKKISAIILPNGENLKVDMVVYAIGTTPNTEFLKNAGINMDEAGFIKTNVYLQSNYPDIYAAGDAALIYNKIWKTLKPSVKWKDAVDQGQCAAKNMLQANACQYKGIAPVIVSKPFGNRWAAAEREPGVSLVDKVIDNYPLYIRTSLGPNNVLKSFVFINGDMPQLSILRDAIFNQEPFDNTRLLQKNDFEDQFDNANKKMGYSQ